ncbi:hypothetical protein E2P81_ATG03726 [Venturia nashicola]|nr:hypothetical protein E2P81_ATG03726 [Venturia nashicola]
MRLFFESARAMLSSTIMARRTFRSSSLRHASPLFSQYLHLILSQIFALSEALLVSISLLPDLINDKEMCAQGEFIFRHWFHPTGLRLSLMPLVYSRTIALILFSSKFNMVVIFLHNLSLIFSKSFPLIQFLHIFPGLTFHDWQHYNKSHGLVHSIAKALASFSPTQRVLDLALTICRFALWPNDLPP